jgi:ribonuclease BN (tRNA processing enzyme)
MIVQPDARRVATQIRGPGWAVVSKMIDTTRSKGGLGAAATVERLRRTDQPVAEIVPDTQPIPTASVQADVPPVVPSFGYRFDARDRSIVISGDTAPSDNLVKLARGADVLVHSVMYPPAIDRPVGRVPSAAALKESILAHQTSAEDAGRIAQAAGVKTLVLSHYVPADDPQITGQMWTDAAQSRFGGKVVLGRICWRFEPGIGRRTGGA